MKYLYKLMAFMIYLLLPMATMAHGYWLEVEGENRPHIPVTVKMYYGDYPAGEKLTGAALDKMKDIKVFVTSVDGTKQELPMKQANDCWEGSFTPHADGMYYITGINDVREVQDWTPHGLGITRPIQYLATEYKAGNKKTGKYDPMQVDVALKRSSYKDYEIVVLKGGKKLPGHKVIITGYGKDAQELTTDKNGKVAFKLNDAGLYILAVEWTDKKPGEYKGKKYETVRHRLDYSLVHK